MDDYDNPPSARQVSISENNLDQVLAAHQSWLHSRPRVGGPGDLTNIDMYGMDLSNKDLRYVQLQGSCLRNARLRNLRGAQLGSADLTKADLVGAYAKEAVFSDANLTYANLRGANLKGARFSGANLMGAIFRDADLQDATFAGAKGILAEQFAGANVSGTDLPRAVRDFESLKIADEASKNCRKLHFTMIAACAYSWLTIATTTDANLLLNSASLSLPIIGSRIPIVGFYCVVPLLLLALYAYFNLNLQRLWEMFAELPAVFPDGSPLDRKSYPWLLNGLVRNYLPRLQDECPAFFKMQSLTSIGVAWWIVPITILCFWFRSITRHSWELTLFLLVLTIIGFQLGYKFSTLARLTLPGGKPSRLSWRTLRTERRLHRDTAVALVLCLTLSIVSFGAVEGIPPRIDKEASYPRRSLVRYERWDPRVWVPKAMQVVGYDPFPMIADADLSEKPANWDLTNKDLIAIKGARLVNARLAFAYGVRTFLANADLEYANLYGAILQYADLRNSNCGSTNFAYADLLGTDLRGASFRGADLSRTLLNRANATGADFQSAKGMTPNQIRAMENWDHALYDSNTLENLHLPQNHNEGVLKETAK